MIQVLLADAPEAAGSGTDGPVPLRDRPGAAHHRLHSVREREERVWVRAVVWGTVVATALAGCGAGDAPSIDADLPPVRPLRVDAVIGALDSSGPDAFGRISGLAADAAGRVFVVDEQTSRIQVFGPDGRFLFGIGGSGQGPGELSRPCCLSFGPQGRLWVRDRGNGRYSVFQVGPDGARFVRTVSMAHNDPYRPVPATFDGEGRLSDVGSYSENPNDPRGLKRFLRSADGEVAAVEEIPEPSVEELGGEVVTRTPEPGTLLRLKFLPPFGPRDLTAFGPEGSRVEGVTSRYELRLHRGDSVLLLTRPILAGPPLSRSEEEEARDRLANWEEMAELASGRGRSVPERKAVLEGAGFDAAGHLWVEVTTPDGAPRLAEVWSPAGELVARYEWPGDVELRPFGWIGRDRVVGVRTDSLGVNFAVVMRRGDFR